MLNTDQSNKNIYACTKDDDVTHHIVLYRQWETTVYNSVEWLKKKTYNYISSTVAEKDSTGKMRKNVEEEKKYPNAH